MVDMFIEINGQKRNKNLNRTSVRVKLNKSFELYDLKSARMN